MRIKCSCPSLKSESHELLPRFPPTPPEFRATWGVCPSLVKELPQNRSTWVSNSIAMQPFNPSKPMPQSPKPSALRPCPCNTKANPEPRPESSCTRKDVVQGWDTSCSTVAQAAPVVPAPDAFKRKRPAFVLADPTRERPLEVLKFPNVRSAWAWGARARAAGTRNCLNGKDMG